MFSIFNVFFCARALAFASVPVFPSCNAHCCAFPVLAVVAYRICGGLVLNSPLY